jgi:hypothetical protein
MTVHDEGIWMEDSSWDQGWDSVHNILLDLRNKGGTVPKNVQIND